MKRFGSSIFSVLILMPAMILSFAAAGRAQRAVSKETLASELPPPTGGDFTLGKSVTAGGGGETQNPAPFAAAVTSGQAVAGGRSQAGQFTLYTGFWAPDFVPTAAAVTIGGQVLTSSGAGIRNVSVTLTDDSGASRTVGTAAFGYYRFTGVEVGRTYIVSIRAKRYNFAQPTLVLTVNEELREVNFYAFGN
jgi:hypothetical protein